ncbi:MAG: response regulator [bacterium]
MEPEQGKKFRILIVDDNVNNLQVLGNILRENGYIIGFANNGKQALDILKTNRDFDLVLLDIDMPIMDGYETCKEIRRDVLLAEMPVIFLTAFSDRDTIIKGLELGAQDYVVKPFNSRELMLRIETHLQIKYKNEQLKDMNDFLEQKVDERTIDLLEANKKLSKLDIAKNYFIGLLSHELRTPLIGINGNAKMIKEVSTDPDILESCDDILTSENRLRKFIDISLLITCIKAEQININQNLEKTNEFITTAIYRLKSIIESKNIIIVNEIVQKDFIICADYSLIAKVFDIIIENAVRFAPFGSEIIIKDASDDENYKIIIKDFGIGFSSDILFRKFELLQVGELLSHTEGTGMSLVAAKSIMELHGYKITIQNAPEGGAVVELIFPNTK